MAEDRRDEDIPRHPLPRSEEARHDEIPEHLEREKGLGDDSAGPVQPAQAPVTPDGTPYGDTTHRED